MRNLPEFKKFSNNFNKLENNKIDKNVYYGAKDKKGGSFGSNLDIKTIKNINHYPNSRFFESSEAINLLKDFFKSKR